MCLSLSLKLIYVQMTHKHSFLKEVQIDLHLLSNIISEMTGDRSPEKIQDLLSYLLEELSYARHQWEQCVRKQDWSLAAKILHREKLFISSLDVLSDPDIMIRLQQQDSSISTSDQRNFYNALIELFQKIELLIGQQNGASPI